jgi:hypothetical protein
MRMREPGNRWAAGPVLSPASEEGHGSWYFTCSVPDLMGRARRVRRGGHATREVALRAREQDLTRSAEQRAADG